MILPPSEAPGTPRVSPCLEEVAASVAEALQAQGLSVATCVRGGPAIAGPRADVALWWCDVGGPSEAHELRAYPSRVHLALMPGLPPSRRALAPFDGVLLTHTGGELHPGPAGPRDHEGLSVCRVRLPMHVRARNEAEKRARKLGTKPCFLVDMRDDFDARAERIVFQLALTRTPITYVLWVPHDERARARVRDLCDRHGLAAWMISGAAAFVDAIPSVDVVIGRLSPMELVWLAAHRVAWVRTDEQSTRPVTPSALPAVSHATAAPTSVLQWSAFLERYVEDPGRAQAQGIGLQSELIGEASRFVDALSEMAPRPDRLALRSPFEPVGPRRRTRAGEDLHPPAPAGAPEGSNEADRIEAALQSLKEKLRNEGEESR